MPESVVEVVHSLATESAQAIAFLASGAASYINGAVVDVNGGLL